MLGRYASSRCAWLFLPDVNSEKQVVKEHGRNVLCFGCQFSKTKGIEGDSPQSGIALLSSTIKSYISIIFVVVGLDFWRVKYKKLLLLIYINLVGKTP